MSYVVKDEAAALAAELAQEQALRREAERERDRARGQLQRLLDMQALCLEGWRQEMEARRADWEGYDPVGVDLNREVDGQPAF